MERKHLSGRKKIVVKIGTSLITTSSGRLNSKQMESLVNQVAMLRKQGHLILVVTSGAIAAGIECLGLKSRPKEIPKLQAAASVGQGLLVERYANLFNKYNLKVGQVLVTQFDVTHRQQYLNTRNTLNKLFELGVVPVVNENDTTAIDEIKFGDNDTLAALVASLIKADLLILLSDIEGLYTADPRLRKDAKLVCEVEDITSEVESLAGGVGTKFGSGGMITKIQAGKIATFSGVCMIIADGRKPNVVLDIVDGRPVGTVFLPKKKKVSSKKLWIAFGHTSKGKIKIDNGAKKAIIEGGKSLLPAGTIDCFGKFSVGDSVDIVDLNGEIFAKGLTNFSSDEIKKIKGLRRGEVVKKLSEEASEEIIHRDCLVVLK
ncbi:glutamate 5-kinase [Candidatus Oleimmundimicrobium sp.]|uniref:glutamate 5-kinase n=1 Tax=Candidatus Oleimmundimicrobium sp. TaxID=3060597 RepID=UPI0027231A87|nr:glutamate 5-kinase [Candidatus Oleimmundimicrobium sp.]MDO8886149.1 glutamate 5-kinase [Candidatus Oleimmundimicrobium sp.]